MHEWLKRMDGAEDFPGVTPEMLDPMLLAWREGWRTALRDGPPLDGWAEYWQQQAAEWKRRALAAEGKRYCSEAGPPEDKETS